MGLAPARARTVYALADAFFPQDGAAVDVVPALEALLARLPAAEAQALLRGLVWLEWLPRLVPDGRRGLAWMPREVRRRWLEARACSAIAPLRRTSVRWRGLLEAAHAAMRALQSSPPEA